MEKIEIKNLHDLVALGIKLQKQDLPDGFIVTVFTKTEYRKQIYADMLENRIDSENWKIEGKFIDGYSFKMLGINFLILTNYK